MQLQAHGLAAEIPRGWDGRLYRRDDPDAGATTNPILHAASVPLPAERGDYGSGVVELLGPDDVFVALVEFDSEAAGTPLFRRQGFPRRLRTGQFGPDRLQRTLPGQGGLQLFFHTDGRAYCLYVVLGSYARRERLLDKVHALLDTIEIAPAEAKT